MEPGPDEVALEDELEFCSRPHAGQNFCPGVIPCPQLTQAESSGLRNAK